MLTGRVLLRYLLRLVFAGAAAWVAWAAYVMWQAAARNSASPGAIVLLGISGMAAALALVALLSVLLAPLLRRRGG